MKRLSITVLVVAVLVSLLPWGRFGEVVYEVLALVR
jgi:hypothetical protein